MIIDLTPINYNKQDEILINEEINIEKEKLKGTEIEKLKNIFVKGRIYKDSLEEITLELKVTGTMTIPCSRTLKPTEYEFETEIEENIENTKKNTKNY